jgi:hypothetical protein
MGQTKEKLGKHGKFDNLWTGSYIQVFHFQFKFKETYHFMLNTS